MSRRPKKIKSNLTGSASGQIILEYILLMVVVLGLSAILRDFLRDQNIAATFTFEPWGKLDGMIQCGVWTDRCGVGKRTPGFHPTAGERHLTLDPDPL